jgi:hypothetical protein
MSDAIRIDVLYYSDQEFASFVETIAVCDRSGFWIVHGYHQLERDTSLFVHDYADSHDYQLSVLPGCQARRQAISDLGDLHGCRGFHLARLLNFTRVTWFIFFPCFDTFSLSTWAVYHC